MSFAFSRSEASTTSKLPRLFQPSIECYARIGDDDESARLGERRDERVVEPGNASRPPSNSYHVNFEIHVKPSPNRLASSTTTIFSSIDKEDPIEQ